MAPGAKLLVGKVLADAGYGEDSWVLAGMVWAVDHHADVISMSLGGDTDDGSHPLSQAVNELSAGSDSLFVIADGMGGYEAGEVASAAPTRRSPSARSTTATRWPTPAAGAARNQRPQLRRHHRRSRRPGRQHLQHDAQ